MKSRFSGSASTRTTALPAAILCMPCLQWKLLVCVMLYLSVFGSFQPASAGIRALSVQSVPGGVAVIPLDADVSQVSYAGRGVMLLADTPSGPFGSAQYSPAKIAILGVSIEQQPGLHTLQVQSRDHGSYRVEIEILSKRFPEQRLTIANKRKVNPLTQDISRIQRESIQMREQYARFTALSASPFPLLQPVKGRISSRFGFRRVLNGQPRNPHSGLDIAAPEGTPVRAAAAGEVSLTGDFFFNGNTIFLDHGGGLITMMCHLSEILVAPGQKVNRGDIIGKVGATGRATGPHLHWNVSLNGERVDPLAAIDPFSSQAQTPDSLDRTR